MGLIKHEVYKIFKQRVIYVVFLIFVALYSLYFFSDSAIYPINKEVTGWVNVLGFNFHIGFYFIGGLTIIGLANIFSQEYTSRMDRLIFSSKHGRKQIVFAKIAAVLVYVISVTLAFTFIVTTLNGAYFGLAGWGYPLKEIDNFYYATYYEGSIISFYVLQQLLVIFGSFLLGLFILFLSSLTKRALIPALVGGFIFLIPDIMMSWKIDVPFVSTFVYKLFVYKEFIALDYIGFPRTLPYTQLFGVDLYYEQYLIVRMLIVFIISCVCIFYSVRKRQVI